MDWFRWAELDVPPIGGVARVADVVGAFGDELSRVDSRVGDELSRVDSRLESSRILDLIVDVLHEFLLLERLSPLQFVAKLPVLVLLDRS